MGNNQCPSNYTFDSATNTCISNCPENSTPDGKVCTTSCPVNYPDKGGYCERPCKDDSTIDMCPTGYEYFQNECFIKCPDGGTRTARNECSYGDPQPICGNQCERVFMDNSAVWNKRQIGDLIPTSELPGAVLPACICQPYHKQTATLAFLAGTITADKYNNHLPLCTNGVIRDGKCYLPLISQPCQEGFSPFDVNGQTQCFINCPNGGTRVASDTCLFELPGNICNNQCNYVLGRGNSSWNCDIGEICPGIGDNIGGCQCEPYIRVTDNLAQLGGGVRLSQYTRTTPICPNGTLINGICYTSGNVEISPCPDGYSQFTDENNQTLCYINCPNNGTRKSSNTCDYGNPIEVCPTFGCNLSASISDPKYANYEIGDYIPELSYNVGTCICEPYHKSKDGVATLAGKIKADQYDKTTPRCANGTFYNDKCYQNCTANTDFVSGQCCQVCPDPLKNNGARCIKASIPRDSVQPSSSNTWIIIVIIIVVIIIIILVMYFALRKPKESQDVQKLNEITEIN